MLVYSIAFFLLLYYYKTLTKWFGQDFYSTAYTFLEYLLFTSFIFLNISNKRIRKVIIILSLGFIIFQSVYLFNIHIKGLDTLAIGIETILLFSYVICFFHEQFKKPTSLSIYNHYCFWISVGILLYLGGSFFFYILIHSRASKMFLQALSLYDHSYRINQGCVWTVDCVYNKLLGTPCSGKFNYLDFCRMHRHLHNVKAIIFSPENVNKTCTHM